MKVRSMVNIGGVTYNFETEERSDMEGLHKAIVLATPRNYCNVCKSSGLENFKLTTNVDKEGNIYVNLKCKCDARSKLGQYKTGNGFFWREFEMPPVVTQRPANTPSVEPAPQDIDF